MARSILSGISVEEFREAVARGDWEALTSVSGIGRKLAQRLVVELRERLGLVGAGELTHRPGVHESDAAREAILAMVSLGFKGDVARRAVQKALEEGEAPVEDLIKRALRYT